MSKFLLYMLCIFLAILAGIEFLVKVMLENVGTFVFGFVAIACFLSIITDRSKLR